MPYTENLHKSRFQLGPKLISINDSLRESQGGTITHVQQSRRCVYPGVSKALSVDETMRSQLAANCAPAAVAKPTGSRKHKHNTSKPVIRIMHIIASNSQNALLKNFCIFEAISASLCILTREHFGLMLFPVF